MRVLLVSDRMSNPGGAERYIEFMRDGLRARGDKAELISCGARIAGPSSSDHDAFSSDSLPLKAFLQVANPAAASRIRAVVRSFAPDVALVSQFAYHFSPSALTALAGVPVVLSMMDYKTICPLGTRMLPSGAACVERAGIACRRNECVGILHWLRDQARYSRIRSEMKSVRRVICPSNWMVREFAANGVDAEQISFGVPAPGESFAYLPAPHPRFVYCGRLSPEKGVLLLLSAFSKFVDDVPHATLSLVGDGPMREEIERQIGILGLSRSVSITGWLSPGEVDIQLSSAWALVAPSLWAEPFGIAAIEAIIRGIPVIASDSGGLAENIENGVTGLLFTPGSESSLVQALRRVAMRTVFRAGRIELDAMDRSRARFSLDVHVERMRKVFLEVM